LGRLRFQLRAGTRRRRTAAEQEDEQRK
jgi:hypothetical protein